MNVQPSTSARVPRARRSPAPPHPSPDERVDRGLAARAAVPLEAHAEVDFAGRPDPVAVLESQAVSRVPELIPIRHARMLLSPFTFYRGAAAVMSADLARTPASGLLTQICGDAHLANFGMFGSPERRLLFDVNDFDETYPGPWEWDVKRLAASLVVAARGNGFTAKDCRKIVRAGVGRYRAAMARFAGMGNLEVWYARGDVDEAMTTLAKPLDKATSKRMTGNLAKARTRDSLKAASKLTEVVDGQWRIKADPPLVVPIADLLPDHIDREMLREGVHALIRSYRRALDSDRRVLLESYEFVDLARKVVGVGSVGTRCWVVLMRGRDDGDPLLLQVKEAQRSVVADQVKGVAKTAVPRNEGERVVQGQRLMQSASDIFLGWDRVDGLDGVQRDFYVRQLRDWKGSAVIETMPAAMLSGYAEICGWTLARAHARSGDRVAISAYLGEDDTFDRAVARFSEAYADQNALDHAALAEAVSSGRVAAEEVLAAG